MSEPEIIINGERLTSAQAVLVRIAVSHFHAEVVTEEYRDGLGEGEIADAYAARASEVERIMFGRQS